MADIILVQPKAGKWEAIGIRSPDSLLTIAAVPYNKGYNVKIIDQRLGKDWQLTLKKELKKSPLCVGITSMTGVQIRYAVEISKFVKENSDVPIVWGGVHASLLPEQTIRNPYIDIVLVGEGDYTLINLVKALENDRNLKNIKGILYREGRKIVKNEPAPLIEDLDKLPDLPYNLINIKKYYGLDINGKQSITLMTSRGCPYRCAFCYNTVFHKRRWRGQSTQKVLRNIKYVKEELGISNIFFEDDNFCANINRFKDIIDGILREKIDIKWGLLGVRINSLKIMELSFLNKVQKAGCFNMDVGIESGSDRILKLIKKDTTIPEIIDVNKKLSKFSFITKYTFMGGYPTETEEELKMSIRLALRLIKENKGAYTPFFICTAYPGTELYGLAIKKGFVPPKTLEGWSTFDYDNAYLNYKWLSRRRINMLRNLVFTSNFANKNVRYKISKRYIKILFDIYYPIAKFRFEKNFYYFPIERDLANKIAGAL